MSNRKFTLIELMIVVVFVFIIPFLISWCMNLHRLVNCDFEAPYKAEIIYGVSAVTIIPTIVTGFMDIEDGTEEELKGE